MRCFCFFDLVFRILMNSLRKGRRIGVIFGMLRIFFNDDNSSKGDSYSDVEKGCFIEVSLGLICMF